MRAKLISQPPEGPEYQTAFGLIYERGPFVWCDWIDQDITVDVYGVGLWEDRVLILQTDTVEEDISMQWLAAEVKNNTISQ